MTIKKLLLSTFLLTAVLSAESTIGLDINSEDIEAIGSYKLNSTMGYAGEVSFLVNASYLHNDKDDLFTVGLSGENSLEDAEGLIFGYGLQAVFAKDFMVFPLLGKIQYILPFDSDIPTASLFASYAYAPSFLSFLDAYSYSELRLEAGIDIISNIHIFTGYRNIDTNYIYEDYNLNDSFYGGLTFSF